MVNSLKDNLSHLCNSIPAESINQQGLPQSQSEIINSGQVSQLTNDLVVETLKKIKKSLKVIPEGEFQQFSSNFEFLFQRCWNIAKNDPLRGPQITHCCVRIIEIAGRSIPEFNGVTGFLFLKESNQRNASIKTATISSVAFNAIIAAVKEDIPLQNLIAELISINLSQDPVTFDVIKKSPTIFDFLFNQKRKRDFEEQVQHLILAKRYHLRPLVEWRRRCIVQEFLTSSVVLSLTENHLSSFVKMAIKENEYELVEILINSLGKLDNEGAKILTVLNVVIDECLNKMLVGEYHSAYELIEKIDLPTVCQKSKSPERNKLLAIKSMLLMKQLKWQEVLHVFAEYIKVKDVKNSTSVVDQYLIVFLCLSRFKLNKLGHLRTKSILCDCLKIIEKSKDQIPVFNNYLIPFLYELNLDLQFFLREGFQLNLCFPHARFLSFQNNFSIDKLNELFEIFGDRKALTQDYYKARRKSENKNFRNDENEIILKSVIFKDLRAEVVVSLNDFESINDLSNLLRAFIEQLKVLIRNKKWEDEFNTTVRYLPINVACRFLFIMTLEKYMGLVIKGDRKSQELLDNIIFDCFALKPNSIQILQNFEELSRLLKILPEKNDDGKLLHILLKVIDLPKKNNLTIDKVFGSEKNESNYSFKGFRHLLNPYIFLMQYLTKRIHCARKTFENGKKKFFDYDDLPSHARTPMDIFHTTSPDWMNNLKELQKMDDRSLLQQESNFDKYLDVNVTVKNVLYSNSWMFRIVSYLMQMRMEKLSFIDSNGTKNNSNYCAYYFLEQLQYLLSLYNADEANIKPEQFVKESTLFVKFLNLEFNQLIIELKEYEKTKKSSAEKLKLFTFKNTSKDFENYSHYIRSMLDDFYLCFIVDIRSNKPRIQKYVKTVYESLHLLKDYFAEQQNELKIHPKKYMNKENKLLLSIYDRVEEAKLYFQKQIVDFRHEPLNPNFSIDYLEFLSNTMLAQESKEQIFPLHLLVKSIFEFSNHIEDYFFEALEVELEKEEHREKVSDYEWMRSNDFLKRKRNKQKNKNEVIPAKHPTIPKTVIKENEDVIEYKTEEIPQEIHPPAPCIKHVPQVKQQCTSILSLLSNQLLTYRDKSEDLRKFSWQTPNKSSKNIPVDDQDKIFRLDQCYHIEHMEWLLDMLSELSPAEIRDSYSFLIPDLLNHLYLFVEQNLTQESYQTSIGDPFFHGLKDMAASLKTKASWEEIDQYTTWYRYPYNKLRSMKDKGQSVPYGLQLILNAESNLSQLEERYQIKQKNLYLEDPESKLKSLLNAALNLLLERTEEYRNKFKINDKDPELTTFVKEYRQRVQNIKLSFDGSTKKTVSEKSKESELTPIIAQLKAILNKLSKNCDPKLFDSIATLSIHLQRLDQCVNLRRRLPAGKYFSLHCRQFYSHLHHSWEHIGLIISLKQKADIRTHKLNLFQPFLAKEGLASPELEELLADINIVKGSDYPYWESIKLAQEKQSTLPMGLVAMSRAYSRSRDDREIQQGTINPKKQRVIIKTMEYVLSRHILHIKQAINKLDVLVL